MGQTMSRATVAIMGGRIVTASAIFEATVTIDSTTGQIRSLDRDGKGVDADEVIDASGLLIMPGGIDTHSHLNDPGLTESEDFQTGTSAAAAGGYTTVLEMPQTQPLVDSVDTFIDKRQTVSPKAIVDFGLYSALVPDNCGDVEALDAIAQVGAIAMKGFICDTPEMTPLNESQLTQGMRNAIGTGLPIAVHCEFQPVIDRETARLRQEGAADAFDIAGCHPIEAEEESVRVALAAARASGGKLHLVHMSDPRTVRLATEARAAGVDVSIETCPHYLALTIDELHEVGGWGLCFPPLRSAASVEGLWRAVENGAIDAIGSDHCAYTLDQKVTSDPWDILPGINGMQMALPVLVDGALSRGVSLTAVARAFSTNPADRYGLGRVKGDIRVGADADLVFVDPEATMTVHADELFTRCPGTIYDGKTFKGRVRRTMVRGTTVYVDEGTPDVVVDPGFGRFLHGKVVREHDDAVVR
jgi:allantoinase